MLHCHLPREKNLKPPTRKESRKRRMDKFAAGLKKRLSMSGTKKAQGGHRLGGGDDSSDVGSRSSVSGGSKTNVLKNVQEKAKQKVQGSDYRPPPDRISEVEKQARRERQTAAAEQRSQTWDKKVTTGRRQRAEEDKRAPIDFGEESISSKQPIPSHQLLEGGFNPYEAQFSSSTNARAAVVGGAAGASSAAAAAPSLSSSDSTNTGGNSNVWTCPVCGESFSPPPSEEEAVMHVEQCLQDNQNGDGAGAGAGAGTGTNANGNGNGNGGFNSSSGPGMGVEDDVAGVVEGSEGAVDAALLLLKQAPQDALSGAVTTLCKLLGNLSRVPLESKFRQVRLSNAAIQARVGNVAGGLDILTAVGFKLVVETDEAADRFLRISEPMATAVVEAGVVGRTVAELQNLLVVG